MIDIKKLLESKHITVDFEKYEWIVDKINEYAMYYGFHIRKHPRIRVFFSEHGGVVKEIYGYGINDEYDNMKPFLFTKEGSLPCWKYAGKDDPFPDDSDKSKAAYMSLYYMEIMRSCDSLYIISVQGIRTMFTLRKD